MFSPSSSFLTRYLFLSIIRHLLPVFSIDTVAFWDREIPLFSNSCPSPSGMMALSKSLSNSNDSILNSNRVSFRHQKTQIFFFASAASKKTPAGSRSAVRSEVSRCSVPQLIPSNLLYQISQFPFLLELQNSQICSLSSSKATGSISDCNTFGNPAPKPKVDAAVEASTSIIKDETSPTVLEVI